MGEDLIPDIECQAELIIEDDSLDVYSLSNCFGKTAIIEEQQKENYHFLPGGIFASPSHNRWCYRTDVKSVEVEDILTELRLSFANEMDRIVDLKNKNPSLKIMIRVIIHHTEPTGPGIFVDPLNMSFAARLGGAFNFVIRRNFTSA